MTEEYDDDDGRRVWLDRTELKQLVETLGKPRRKLAARLGAEAGLRSHEIVAVEPRHVYHDPEASTMLKVPEGKGDKYRETVIPGRVAEVIEALGHGAEAEPVVDVSKRSLRYWIADARKELLEEDTRWQYVTSHDLRRTWAGMLANADVDETVALRWGGWNDLETFLDHYRGEATAKAQARERSKVNWL